MDHLFHGCYYANVDGKNKLIAPGKDSFARMRRCFLKHPDGVNSHVKTRSMTSNEPSVGWRVINNYYKDKQIENGFI